MLEQSGNPDYFNGNPNKSSEHMRHIPDQQPPDIIPCSVTIQNCPMKTYVKICGITGIPDAEAAALAGADFIGIILDIPESPRSVSLDKARQIISASRIPAVVLMEKSVTAALEAITSLHPHAVQLIGNTVPEDIVRLKTQTGCRIFKTVSIPGPGSKSGSAPSVAEQINRYKKAGTDAIILDTLVPQKKGGTGQVCDWDMAEALNRSCGLPLFLAGGIRPDNVRDAVIKVRPYGVDLSSGVEKAPGKKDFIKMTELVNNVRTIK